MVGRQGDLSAHVAIPAPVVVEVVVAVARARLVATLALVRAAETMPWRDPLRIVREDEAFAADAVLLPGGEGAALWGAYDGRWIGCIG